LDEFAPPLHIIEERRLSLTSDSLLTCVEDSIPWDESVDGDQAAVLVARLDKPKR